MQKQLLFIVFCILPISYALNMYAAPVNTAWRYHPFDAAMQKISHLTEIGQTEQVVQIDGITLYNFLRNLYELNNPLVLLPQETLKIPKIIHQIWLGSPVPEVYKKLMQTWIDMHPDWKYHLWTDENVHELILYNQELYNEAKNYGVKSDILRWEILYRYGGLYVDVDYECLHSFDEFHYIYDLYTGIQPLDTLMVQLGAALVGARPGHPVLKHCIETIREHWHL
jgi:hypothetical protein